MPQRAPISGAHSAALMAKLRRRCAILDVLIHDLRHSLPSRAMMDNVPPTIVGTLLSRLLSETTAKYAHFANDVVAEHTWLAGASHWDEPITALPLKQVVAEALGGWRKSA